MPRAVRVVWDGAKMQKKERVGMLGKEGKHCAKLQFDAKPYFGGIEGLAVHYLAKNGHPACFSIYI